MNIDANKQERDEFDGDPLNPKHIEAVCGYLKNSPRDNLKKQALEIIEAQKNVIEGQSTEVIKLEEVICVMKEENRQLGFKRDDADKAAKNSHQMAIQLSMQNEALLVENGMLKHRAKPSLISRIVLWFKGK